MRFSKLAQVRKRQQPNQRPYPQRHSHEFSSLTICVPLAIRTPLSPRSRSQRGVPAKNHDRVPLSVGAEPNVAASNPYWWSKASLCCPTSRPRHKKPNDDPVICALIASESGGRGKNDGNNIECRLSDRSSTFDFSPSHAAASRLRTRA